MDVQHGGLDHTRVVDQFEAEEFGAPFKIILERGVRVKTDAKTGEIVSYTIPDPDGLVRAVVFARILHERKLSGLEIKWLRKAVGVKQKDLAPAISTTPEHLSRCETTALVLGPASEKLLRLFLFKTAAKLHQMKECETKVKLERLLSQLFDSHEPVSAHDADDVLELHFERRASGMEAGNDNDGDWDDLKQVVG